MKKPVEPQRVLILPRLGPHDESKAGLDVKGLRGTVAV